MPTGLIGQPLQGGLRTKGLRKADRPNEPLVSIVTVVLNGERHIRQTIESVLNQTYGNVEYLILDGGSSDNTLNIIREYEEKIDFWRSEKDGGIYAAMNAGVAICKGTLIGLKNADDWYTPHAVDDAVATHLQTGADIVYGDTEVVWQEQPLKTSLFRSNHTKIKENGGIDHRTIFATRLAYDAAVYDTRYRICADYDWYLRLLEQGFSFAHTGTVIGYKRPGGMSASGQTVRDIFAINKAHFGLPYALKVRLKQLVIQGGLQVGNRTLKLLMGPEAFARFKARKRQ